MSPSVRAPLLLLAVLGGLALLFGPHRANAGPAAAAGSPRITAAVRAASFRWDGVAPGDQQAVLAAVAAARPEARRLIGEVDGLVRISVGPVGADAVGLTSVTPTGYAVRLDLGTISRQLGVRGLGRLVLHELGHVVDFQLLDPALDARLDAEIPAGYGCRGGNTGGCAASRERFAETFAKWALNDIGVNLSIGYDVPPPSVPLSTWGAPLAALPLG